MSEPLDEVPRIGVPITHDRSYELIFTLDAEGQSCTNIIHNNSQTGTSSIMLTQRVRNIQDFQLVAAQALSYWMLFETPELREKGGLINGR